MDESKEKTSCAKTDYVVSMDYGMPVTKSDDVEGDGFYVGQEVDRIFNSAVHVQASFIAGKQSRSVNKLIRTPSGHHDDLCVQFGMSLGEVAMLLLVRRDARKTLKIQKFVRDKEMAEQNEVWHHDSVFSADMDMYDT